MVERLGQRIVAGEPAPGEALPPESLLAAEYEVSRTVVREALRVLAAKGLVDARPMRGTRVRPPTEWRLLDADLLRWALDSDRHPSLFGHLIEIRAMVEPTVARLAAARSTPPQHDQLARAFDELVDASVELAAFIEADLALHDLLFRMSGNPLLDELFTSIEASLRLGRRVQASGAGQAARSPIDAIEAHRQVVEAVIAGDGEQAQASMRAVVEAAAADMQRALPASAQGPAR
jgi:DNA-binding FadR family transcriptional regulator